MISYHRTGTVRGWTYINDQSQEIILSNVLHAPDLCGRFLSTRRLDEKGYSTLFQNSEATICKNDHIIGIGKLQSQLYWLQLSTIPSLHASTAGITPDILHQYLGHLNWNTIRKIKDSVQGIRIQTSHREQKPCEGCLKGKQHRRPFSTSQTPCSSNLFNLIHSDLAGPMQTQSVVKGASYMLLFINDHSRHVWLYLLQLKNEQIKAFWEFYKMIETQHNQKIKCLRTD
jgi:hypothetical protein